MAFEAIGRVKNYGACLARQAERARADDELESLGDTEKYMDDPGPASQSEASYGSLQPPVLPQRNSLPGAQIPDASSSGSHVSKGSNANGVGAEPVTASKVEAVREGCPRCASSHSCPVLERSLNSRCRFLAFLPLHISKTNPSTHSLLSSLALSRSLYLYLLSRFYSFSFSIS